MELTLILVAILSFLLLLALAAVVYARWHYGSLEKLGIPVVPPHWLLGSSPRGYAKLSHVEDEERAKQYGGVYGAYEGRQPKIFISSPSLVKKILVKDFDYFYDRKKWELLEHAIPHEFLDFQPGNKWRVMRAMITPALSLGRVKNMLGIAWPQIRSYMKELEGKERIPGFDSRSFTTPMIIDLSNLLFLGVRSGSATDPNNDFVHLIRNFFVDSVTKPPGISQTIGYAFPLLGKLISPGPFGIPFFPKSDLDKFAEHTLRVLKIQKSRPLTPSGSGPTDTVTVLLQMMEKIKTAECKELGITQITVLAQIFELYMAAYEGFPTAIATNLYHIASHPNVQDRLLKEIDTLLQKDEIRYDSIAELPYLSACLQETFRIFPTFHRVDRLCTMDWEDKELGIKITKGIPVFIALWPLHHNPELYPDPYVYKPERWLDDSIDPYAFGVFGHGPKACPGMRFISDLLKIGLFEILKDFRVESVNGFSVKFHPGFGPFVKTDPLLVDLVRRNW